MPAVNQQPIFMKDIKIGSHSDSTEDIRVQHARTRIRVDRLKNGKTKVSYVYVRLSARAKQSSSRQVLNIRFSADGTLVSFPMVADACLQAQGQHLHDSNSHASSIATKGKARASSTLTFFPDSFKYIASISQQ